MTKIRWDSRLTTNKISKYDISFLRKKKKKRNENYKSHQAITTTFSNRRIKSFSFLLFLYHRPEVLWFDPARPSLIQNDTSHCIRHRCKRHKKRKKKKEEKYREEKGPRRGWKERFEPRGYYLGRRGGGGVFHYTLRKFICVDGAHFSTGRPRTWASQVLHSIRRTMVSRCTVSCSSTWFIFRRWHSIVPRVSHSLPSSSPYYVVENQRAKNDP